MYKLEQSFTGVVQTSLMQMNKIMRDEEIEVDTVFDRLRDQGRTQHSFNGDNLYGDKFTRAFDEYFQANESSVAYIQNADMTALPLVKELLTSDHQPELIGWHLTQQDHAQHFNGFNS